MLNLGSLILGLLAWTFGAVSIGWRKRSREMSLGSFTCCGTSLIFQFCEIDRRTDISDYAAIEDTIEGIIYCAALLLAVTIILNFAAILRHRRK